MTATHVSDVSCCAHAVRLCAFICMLLYRQVKSVQQELVQSKSEYNRAEQSIAALRQSFDAATADSETTKQQLAAKTHALQALQKSKSDADASGPKSPVAKKVKAVSAPVPQAAAPVAASKGAGKAVGAAPATASSTSSPVALLLAAIVGAIITAIVLSQLTKA
jgi:septal ring factor EnvC (AmiA/AmiB activator)